MLLWLFCVLSQHWKLEFKVSHLPPQTRSQRLHCIFYYAHVLLLTEGCVACQGAKNIMPTKHHPFTETHEPEILQKSILWPQLSVYLLCCHLTPFCSNRLINTPFSIMSQSRKNLLLLRIPVATCLFVHILHIHKSPSSCCLSSPRAFRDWSVCTVTRWTE